MKKVIYMTLADYKNIPITVEALQTAYPNIKSIHSKISSLEDNDKIIRLKRGLYIYSPKDAGRHISNGILANHIYGPSYISRETALRYYGLIPEKVYMIRSMATKHSRIFENKLGTFEYTECGKDYFHIGITQVVENEDNCFLIATKEKALCDTICFTKGLELRFQKDVINYLENDIRFDMDEFFKMDITIFEECLKVCKKKNTINNIIKILSK